MFYAFGFKSFDSSAKYKIMKDAPWTSFAKHAQKKLQEEWNKKNPFEKTVSSFLS